MTGELMRDFGIGAKNLGNLSAAYFYAYVAMQIPTGVLVDTWGARKLLIAGSISAAAGTFLFGFTGNFLLACFARAAVGGATAVAWVVTLNLVMHWFASRRFAMLSGVSLFVGNIGALVAQVPLRFLVEHFPWRSVILASGVVILAVTALAFAIVRNDPSEYGYSSQAPLSLQHPSQDSVWSLLKGFKQALAYRNTWLIFFAQGGFLGAMLAFAGLWGPPFLIARFHLTATRAAALCSLMLVFWATACPIMGYLSDKMGKRKPIYLTGAAAALVGWVVLFYWPHLSLITFTIIAALTSFCAGAIILGFAFGKESVPQQYFGTITGGVNMGNMLGPMLLQPGIGWVLDKQWSGKLVNGVRAYSAADFRTAFLLIVVWSALSVILISLTKETSCKQTA
ncbi:MAG: MFS transporter [Acidobacteria bacterium]|nr:MFS transporter [Acidobacteriota bacterium]